MVLTPLPLTIFPPWFNAVCGFVRQFPKKSRTMGFIARFGCHWQLAASAEPANYGSCSAPPLADKPPVAPQPTSHLVRVCSLATLFSCLLLGGGSGCSGSSGPAKQRAKQENPAALARDL